MHSMNALLLMGFLLSCTSPSAAPSVDEESPEKSRVQVREAESFTLAPGEEAEFPAADLRIRFLGVATDSRCPVDVECVWEGDAEVVLETIQGTTGRSWVLHTAGSPWGSRRVELEGWELALVGLEPSPRSDRAIERERYRAVLRLEENAGRASGSWSSSWTSGQAEVLEASP